MRILYLSHNGLLDPLGQSQVLQYLVGLARRGHAIHLITYEKPDEWARTEHLEATRDVVSKAGIDWRPLVYHRQPRYLGAAFDLIHGLAVAIYLALRHRVEIVHVRGYVLGAIAALLNALPGVRFVFDQRSLWPDELAELGVWSFGSPGHRFAKSLERWFLTTADAVVCLTRSAESTVRAYPYMTGRSQRFSVITTCTNLELFYPDKGRRDQRVFTLGYLGTVGAPYLLDEVFAALLEARKVSEEARLLVINRRDHGYIAARAIACNVPADALEVTAADHRHVVEQLWRMSAGVVFITPTPCRRACAPTKVGELLAAGIPCLANAGVGDLERILMGDRVGVIVPDFTPQSLSAGIKSLLDLCAEPGIAERCAASARRHFSLEDGVEQYHSLYLELAAAR